MEKKSLDNRIIQVLLHLLGWFCFLIYPFILGMPFKEELFYRYFFHTILLAIFFYSNCYFFIPRLLTRGKTGLYFAIIVVIIVLIIFSHYFFRQLFDFDYRQLMDSPPSGRPPMDPDFHRHSFGFGRDIKIFTRPLFSSLFIFAVSTSYRLLMDWFRNEKKKKEIENQNLVSELSFLKSQVSPHFLFNTLNNIYSLSLNNSELTSDAILKLSQLLRYMLYESDVKQVRLDKEIGYLSNYIELQKMRIREDVKIRFTSEGNFSERLIEPMLLIPFIENAFKHGINYSSISDIFIDIHLKKDILTMRVENTLHTTGKEKDKASGIGLANVRRRLILLYPEAHKLSISDRNGKYIVDLEIKLKK